MNKTIKSKGHLEFIGEWEYFTYKGDLYRAKISNDLTINGYRNGARFVCTKATIEKALEMARKGQM